MSLDCELLKRIFGNLGAVPGPNFGKVGLVSNECLSNKTITAQFEDDKTTAEYPVWIGETSTNPSYKAAITNVGTNEDPEFILVFEVDDNTPRLGLRLSWFAEGEFAQQHEDAWQPMSTLHKLNLTAAFEMITQQGIMWMSAKSDTSKLFELLSALAEN